MVFNLKNHKEKMFFSLWYEVGREKSRKAIHKQQMKFAVSGREGIFGKNSRRGC